MAAVSSVPTVLTPPRSRDVWRRYAQYLRKPPLLSIEWADSETTARGWLVINSLRGGAAGGGTRMRAGLGRREVVYLAKAMELKFVFSGPPIGGAKSGIDFDPTDPRRADVLRRWFRAVAPQLREYYGTGGDLNVDEVLDVIPCCEEIGLLHPQEGVVRGHLRHDEAGIAAVLDSLDRGIKAPVSGVEGLRGSRLPLADLITGYGVARSVVHLYARQGREIRGARVIVEGFGAVGGPCALYLARAGARLVAITDREKALVEPDGLAPGEVESLLLQRRDKCLPPDDRCVPQPVADALAAVPADVFVAAACSETLDAAALTRLESQGVRTIACGANQPFRETKLGSTTIARDADQRFSVLPDIVANCGMARAFSFLMTAGAADPDSVFAAVDQTIGTTVAEVHERNAGRRAGLLGGALEYALDEIGG